MVATGERESVLGIDLANGAHVHILVAKFCLEPGPLLPFAPPLPPLSTRSTIYEDAAESVEPGVLGIKTDREAGVDLKAAEGWVMTARGGAAGGLGVGTAAARTGSKRPFGT